MAVASEPMRHPPPPALPRGPADRPSRPSWRTTWKSASPAGSSSSGWRRPAGSGARPGRLRGEPEPGMHTTIGLATGDEPERRSRGRGLARVPRPARIPTGPGRSGGLAPTRCSRSSAGAGWASCSRRSTRHSSGRSRSRCWPRSCATGAAARRRFAREARAAAAVVPRARRHDPRRRRVPRPALPGHAVRRRPVAPGAARPRRARSTLAEILRIGMQAARGPGRGPCPGAGPPRHQAGQHPAGERRRAGQAHRLRPGPGRRRRQPDPERRHRRHAPVHGPRAGPRRAGRPPRRPVQPGQRALRHVPPAGPPFRAESAMAVLRASATTAPADPRAQPRHPRLARGDRSTGCSPRTRPTGSRLGGRGGRPARARAGPRPAAHRRAPARGPRRRATRQLVARVRVRPARRQGPRRARRRLAMAAASCCCPWPAWAPRRRPG